MSFKPLNEPISVEDLSDPQHFVLSSSQQIRDGRLVLVGSPVYEPNPDLNWQEATWSQTSQFQAVPDRTAPSTLWKYVSSTYTSEQVAQRFPFFGRLDASGEFVFEERATPFAGGGNARRARRAANPIFTDPNSTTPLATRGGVTGRVKDGRKRMLPTGRGLLSLEADVGQVNYIRQTTSDLTTKFWSDNVNNSNGYTIELRGSVQSGTSEIILDDGSYRVALQLNPKGIYESSELRLAMDWDEVPQKARIAVRNRDIFMLSEKGLCFTGTSHLNSSRHAPITKEVKIGNMGATEGWLLLDYFHQSHLGVYLDVDDDIGYSMSTSEYTSYTPSINHKKSINSWLSAVVKVEAPVQQLVKVQTQYKNTSNPSWTDYSTPVSIVNGTQEILLTSVPVDKDGSDTLRFGLIQRALATSDKPSPFEEIQVATKFEASPFSLVPNYGLPAGGNTVAIVALDSFTMATSDQVYVGGVVVDNGDITNVSTTRKEVVWPSGSPGQVSVRILQGSSSYYSDTPYRYIDSYDKGLDRYERLDNVCGTRSAFRIKNEVPHGEVNLAYVSSPGIESDSLVGVIDLSYLEDGNIVGGNQDTVLLTSPDTSGAPGTYTYFDAPRTEEIAVARGSAGWRELGVPTPLFYEYRIGRGRYYVKVQQDTLDIKEVRDTLFLHYQDGTEVKLEDYPWDIELSTIDVDGNQLPPNVYNILLLTNKRYIPGLTVFVTTNVVDRSNKYRSVQSHTEVVNPKPTFTEGASTQGYSVDIDALGNFTLEVIS